MTFDAFEQMKAKGSLEFGQLPVLRQSDGTMMAQSGAILRALGIKYGYYPSDAMERWQVDSTIDAINDIFDFVAKCLFGGTDQSKKASLADLLQYRLPKFLKAMNKRLDGKRYMTGREITIADFALGGFFLQTVANEHSPHYEQFLTELQKHEHCIEFIRHFRDDNLPYIESMTPSFF